MREPVPREVREAVVARDGLVCQLCGCSVVRRSFREPWQPDTLHLDHIRQYAHGGECTEENLRVTCARCNQSRERLR
jgi:5-methylcytosine-specific restriction endonuclease McrA